MAAARAGRPDLALAVPETDDDGGGGGGAAAAKGPDHQFRRRSKRVVRKPPCALLESEVLELGLRERWNLAAAASRAGLESRQTSRISSGGSSLNQSGGRRGLSTSARLARTPNGLVPDSLVVDSTALDLWRAQAGLDTPLPVPRYVSAPLEGQLPRRRSYLDVLLSGGGSADDDDDLLEDAAVRRCSVAKRRLRAACARLIRYVWFDRIIIGFILLNSLSLAAQDPRGEPSSFEFFQFFF